MELNTLAEMASLDLSTNCNISTASQTGIVYVYGTTQVRLAMHANGVFSSGLFALTNATVGFAAEFVVPITGWNP